ncbi:MAG: Crp/Fnr family transcriptional regulator [Bacteroidales bacterium]|nr:Crp/Fnr family transcriptional regulator [Bacteroidales bacterium]
MFERLLQLPLFQGLSTAEISDVMSHVRLDFTNHHQGDEIVFQGDSCRCLIYIISGEVTSEYRDIQGRFIYTEELPQTKILEPYNMFGMHQKYSRTYTFATDGCTLTIDKSVVVKHLLNNDIIKINFLNMACNRYQQTQQLTCLFPEDNVRQKIVKFFLSYATIAKGKKEAKIKMRVLADILHETRLNVSITLNKLETEGLLSLQRGMIILKDLQECYRLEVKINN